MLYRSTLMISNFSNSNSNFFKFYAKWCMKQTSVCQAAQASVAYLDKHSTLDPVMVSVVSSISSEGGQLFANIF